MSTSRPASPLGSVIGALERAVESGELSQGDLDWSLNRLSRHFRGEPNAIGGGRQVDIVRAATRVFLRRGYHHATIEEISSELSLTKAAVYHYFGSKQEILEAICSQAMAASEEAMAVRLAAPGTAAERLQRAAEGYADLLLSDERLIVFIRHYDDVSEAVSAHIRSRRKRIERRLRGVLEDGMKEGVFATPDVALAVLEIFGSVNWVYSWYERDGRLSPGEVRDALVNQAMKGVMR